jgi:hypothetical protein
MTNSRGDFQASIGSADNSHWKLEFFKLLESSKPNGIDFPEALREIKCRCGRLEAPLRASS